MTFQKRTHVRDLPNGDTVPGVGKVRIVPLSKPRVSIDLLIRGVLWAFIAPGIPLGWLSTKAFVWAMKKLNPSEPVAGSHTEEFLGLSLCWAIVIWMVMIVGMTR